MGMDACASVTAVSFRLPQGAETKEWMFALHSSSSLSSSEALQGPFFWSKAVYVSLLSEDWDRGENTHKNKSCWAKGPARPQTECQKVQEPSCKYEVPLLKIPKSHPGL